MAKVDKAGSPEKSHRRFPRRWIAAVVIVTAIVASERWGGPLSLENIRSGVSSAAETVSDRFGLDNDDQSVDMPDPVVNVEVTAAAPDGDGPVVYLTFDDGPHLAYTPQILDTLAEHDAKAVFFPIGNQVAAGTALLQRAVAEGHRVGNHTWNHDRLAGISTDRFNTVVGRTQSAIATAAGTTPVCLRPPGGKTDGRTAQLSHDAGLRVVMWTVDPSDWSTPGASAIADRVLEHAGDGDIVLLHDGGGDRAQTVEALDRILDELSDRGFRFPVLPGC